MRQVPPNILIIGSGRLALHWLRYYELLNHSVLHWDRGQDPHALAKKISQATHVYLCISDSALTGFYNQHLAGHDHCQVVHFSGALFNEQIIGAHPLMSFTHAMYDLEFYKQIHFTVDRDINLNKCLPFFENSFSYISPSNKAAYHAHCVMSGNFPHLLWNNSLAAFKKLNIPEQAYFHYLKANLNNFFNSPEGSLTGPLVRKDQVTIENNLKSLSLAETELYQAFVKFYSSQKDGQ